jgi:hypothetical protein
MREYNHNKEIKILLTQVIDAFGNIIIKRINEATGLSEDQIHVNLRYSPKSRIINDIVNKNQHIELPIMALSIGGISYDQTRTFNKIEGFYTDVPQSTSFKQHYQPLPITLSLNLSILTRYQNDLDQIITCLYTFFHPYIVISYIHPEVQEEVRCVVQWDGNLNLQYPNDITSNVPYRITCDSNFKVAGWIYRNFNNPIGKIYKIDHTFQTVNVFDDYEKMKSNQNEINSDFFTISARPFVQQVDPYIATKNLSGQEFIIIGDMFHFLSSIYVSGTEGVFPNAYEIDVFSDFPNLSATYPSFTGLSVENFEVLGEKIAKFTLPIPENNGFVSVIPVNEAGYGNLVIDAIRPTFNPYPSSLPQHFTYVEPQFLWASGIEIKGV